MALPVPNLDDRRFQDLVDDAKRLVQQRCPEWTDHNVSDPGVTLIEAFAFMTDQLLYRLNRVPDRHYVKFLELIGVRLFPPTAARAGVTFCLTAPRPDPVTDRGRHAGVHGPDRDRTRRSPSPRSTTCRSSRARSRAPPRCSTARRPSTARTPLDKSKPFEAFDRVPKPGDSLLIGLSRRRAVLRREPPVPLPDRGRRASTRSARRSSGRPGRARTGRPARSSATTPAASTATATSSCTCRAATPRR